VGVGGHLGKEGRRGCWFMDKSIAGVNQLRRKKSRQRKTQREASIMGGVEKTGGLLPVETVLQGGNTRQTRN